MRNQKIYDEAQPVDCWYRIVSGAACRFTVRPDGRRQIIDLLLPGDWFGFGLGGRHAFSAEAVKDRTTVSSFPVARIQALLASDPAGAPEIYAVALNAISRLHSLLMILGRTTAEEKVGSFLLHMQERTGCTDADWFVLPVSRYDIAEHLALSVETVSRALTGLKQRQTIALRGPRQIGIVDRVSLACADRLEPCSPPQQRRTPQCHRINEPDEILRTKTITVRVASFAFADTLNTMRKWLDHRGCAPSRFTCNRKEPATVTVQVEFSEKFEAIAREFEEQFAGLATAAATS
jgi:CRP-like cAMP-binding protein